MRATAFDGALSLVLLAAAQFAPGCGSSAQPATTTAVPTASQAAAAANPPPAEQKRTADDLARQREELDQTVWANEVAAQHYEAPFVRLWDNLRAARDKVAVLADFPFTELVIESPADSVSIDDGISVTSFGPPMRRMDASDWRGWLTELQATGHQLVESEWHHSNFSPAAAGKPAHSLVSFVLHVVNSGENRRFVVKGELDVEWAPPGPSASGDAPAPRPRRVEARSLRIAQRQGDVPFKQRLAIGSETTGSDPRNSLLLTVYDFNGDDRPDVALPDYNALFWNEGDFHFLPDKLFDHPPPVEKRGRRWDVAAAVVGDFTGDAVPDLLASGRETVFLWVADASGRFTSPPVTVLSSPEVRQPSVLTAGDVDGDGDLDAWLGQYRQPYADGQMPTPYYDANDAFPAFLLQNDGQGRFTDVTAASGLDAKRNRRTFSASLIDLNGDGSLDLVTVNDFSGMDVYSNDGRGKFTDVTDSWLDERHAFGMSHTIGDYDRDGRLDLYMIGMSSTTARRLDAMGLKRTDSPAEHKMRAAMGYGNRMYLAGGKGYRQAPFNDQVARTGWSWGSATLDWDNDGDRDIFVGNGHISRGTAKDYCTRFWCHDIYFNTPRPDPELKRFVQDVVADEMQSMSWNGYEHDCLLLNEGGRGFRDVGFLLGVGFEFDSRNVAAQDLDLDGRVDLIVAEKRLSDGPLLHILQNTAPYKRHWIGVVLRDYGKGRSPLGAQVAARTASARHVGVVVAGDSFQSQHAPVVHFGLGEESQVEELEVRWPDGAVSRLANPTVDRYHRIKPPDAGE